MPNCGEKHSIVSKRNIYKDLPSFPLKKLKLNDDPVNKLDQQVAELKRRQKSAKNSLNGSPIHKNNTKSPTILNILCSPTEKIELNKRVNNNSKNNFFINKKNNTATSSLSSISQKKDSFSIDDTQIIESSEDLDINLKSNRSNNNIRLAKQDALNMIDSIHLSPNKTPIQINNSIETIEVPDSSQSTNSRDSIPEKGKEDDSIRNEIGKTEYDEHIFSSPVKTPSLTLKPKKQVMFSSDIENSLVSSSPIKANMKPRSILKFSESTTDSTEQISIEQLLERDLSKNDSWPSGIVIQIPLSYLNIDRVVNNCVAGLRNKNFNKHYEVYATLNDLIKRNIKIVNNNNIFSKNVIKIIVSSVLNDFSILSNEIKDGSDAFKLRTSSQGLKLLTFLHTETIGVKEISNIYSLIIKVLKNENISKGLASSMFQLVKVLPDSLSDRIENIIYSLVQMKYFSSATLVCEKFNIIKKFILTHPASASKCNYQIFSYVLYTILNTDVPTYSRILLSSISVLAVTARNNESKLVLFKLLSEDLDDSLSSIKSSFEQNDSLKSWMTIGQAICETLRYLIHIELYTQAAKIWSYLLYMVSHGRKKFHFEKWELFTYFEAVYYELNNNTNGILLSLEAWKSVVYNFQVSTIKDMNPEELKNKLELLISPFKNVQLENNSGGKLSQWTKNDSYMVLYCRIYYSLRLKMEEDNLDEFQRVAIFEAMLKPLLQLKEWDNTFAFILKMIFTSEKYIHLETPEMCFWLSDFDKWRSRIIPVPKAIFKNEKIFNVIVKFIKKYATKNIDLLNEQIEICIATSIDNIKIMSPLDEYINATKVSNDLIMYIYEVHLGVIINGSCDDAKTCYSLIEKFDNDFILFTGEIPLLERIFNMLFKCEHIEFVNEFISLCKKRIDNDKLFECCISSDLYNNEQLLINDTGNFPPLIHHPVDMKHMKIPEIKINEIYRKLVKAMSIYLKYEHGSYAEIIEFLLASNILYYLNTEKKRQLFLNLIDMFNGVDFYTETPIIFFIFDNENNNDNQMLQKDIELLLCLPNPENLPSEWIKKVEVILRKIDNISNNSLLKFIEKTKSKLSIELINKLDKLTDKNNGNNQSIDSQIETLEKKNKGESLKSFIIDSIQIKEREKVTTREPTPSSSILISPTKNVIIIDDINPVENTSPARRTRSCTQIIDERKKGKRKIHNDIIQLRSMMRKIGSKRIKLEQYEKDDLEKEILNFLLKLKND